MPIWTLAGAYQFVPLAPVDVTLDGELAAPSWTLVGAYALDPEIIADLAMTGELSAPTWALTGAYDLTAVVLATSVDLIGTLAAPDWTLVGAYEVARPPQTDTGRISGLNLGGYGVATWFPPVVPLPASDDGPKMLVAAAFGPQTMGGTNGTQPVYTISEAHTPRARQQIIVDGEDITGFRNTVTPEVTYQTQEPLLYGPADMVLPQVACTEVFGTGDLSWLRKDANVTVNEVLDDVVTRTLYKGFINAFDISGKTVTVELGGEAHGAMEMENAQVVVVPRINDIGHQAAVDLDKAGIPHHPPLGRVTGIETLTTGGTGLLEHFQAVLAQGWTRAGRKWTVMPDPDTGVYETKRKDDTTIHWTAFIDDARTVLSVRRDTSEEHNRIYGSGVTPRGMRVRNVIIPGLYQGPTPEFPGHMEMGDTGIGVQQLIGKLQQVNYLDLRDTPGGYDEDVYEAVVDLQVDAGMFEDGFTGTAVPGEVNLATWRALYDVDITQQSLGWAHVEPMAQTSRVREWRRSGTGGILGPNPGYDKTVRKRDRNIEFPAGLTRKQQFEFSKAELVEASVENWYGTATFHTGALLRGEVAIGATITDADVMAATEALPGHNLWVPNFMGGTLFHISAAQVAENGIVTATIDTRFRDAMEVWEIMDRNKQAKLDPTRRANQQHRSSTIVKDSIGEWYEHGGILGHDIRLNPGWNVFQVNAAMEGTIARLRLAVQTVTIDGETITLQGHEFALAVFGREITAARLAQIVPAPLTADGKKNWRRKATRDQLKTHWILASFGTDEEPCGYGEDLKSDDAPLTGLIDEDAGFPYRSESRTKLYVAVYVREAAEDATIQAGRIMWPQLESGV